VARRALAATALTWLPLLLLSAVQGLALGKNLQVPFLLDFAANVRFLIALPLLIVSEVGIDRRLRVTVNHFLKSGLVKEADLPSFEAVIERVTRLRDRVFPEIVMLVVAYLPSLSIQSSEILMSSIPSWHLARTPAGEALSYAGWWFGLISVPVYRFLLLRWVWRMFLWASFLWHVSTQTFDAKWVHGRPPEGETLLGSSDIQSLADLGNSFAIVRGMRVAPIDKPTLIGLAIAAVLPMAPVLIRGTPADQLIRTVLKLLA
jgi:hypothetical protein